MSKKDKSKFRKRIREQLSREMAQITSQSARPAPAAGIFQKQPAPAPDPQTAVKPILTVPQETEEKLNYLDFIRRDLKKSALIIGSIIIVIVGLSIIDNRTNILLKAGDQIFKILHIGA